MSGDYGEWSKTGRLIPKHFPVLFLMHVALVCHGGEEHFSY